jgi:hypothetical protein
MDSGTQLASNAKRFHTLCTFGADARQGAPPYLHSTGAHPPLIGDSRTYRFVLRTDGTEANSISTQSPRGKFFVTRAHRRQSERNRDVAMTILSEFLSKVQAVHKTGAATECHSMPPWTGGAKKNASAFR